MIDTLIEALHTVENRGLSWATLLTLFIIYRKNRLKKQDRYYIKMIMEKLDIKIPIEKRFKMPQLNYMTLVPALLGSVKLILNAFHIQFTDEMINEVSNVLAGILALLGIYFSHHKPEVVPVIEDIKQAVKEAPKTYQEVIPIVNDVHSQLSTLSEQLKSGKYTDSMKNSVEIYQEISDLLKKKNI